MRIEGFPFFPEVPSSDGGGSASHEFEGGTTPKVIGGKGEPEFAIDCFKENLRDNSVKVEKKGVLLPTQLLHINEHLVFFNRVGLLEAGYRIIFSGKEDVFLHSAELDGVWPLELIKNRRFLKAGTNVETDLVKIRNHPMPIGNIIAFVRGGAKSLFRISGPFMSRGASVVG